MTRARVAVVVIAAMAMLAAGCIGDTNTNTAKNGSTDTTDTPKNDSTSAKGGMKTFKDPDGLFTVKHPANWFANGTSSLAVEMSPLRSNTNMRSTRDMSVASVEVISGLAKQGAAEIDPGETVDQIVDALLKAKPAASRGPVNKIRIDNAPGAWVSVDMAARTGEQVKMFVAIGSNGRRRVEIFGYSPPDDWAANLKTFKSITESFRFNNPKT